MASLILGSIAAQKQSDRTAARQSRHPDTRRVDGFQSPQVVDETRGVPASQADGSHAGKKAVHYHPLTTTSFVTDTLGGLIPTALDGGNGPHIRFRQSRERNPDRVSWTLPAVLRFRRECKDIYRCDRASKRWRAPRHADVSAEKGTSGTQ